MSEIAKLSIDLTRAIKRIQGLQASAGNIDKEELLSAWSVVRTIGKRGFKATKLIIPSFLDLPATGERAEELKQLTDKRWEEGL